MKFISRVSDKTKNLSKRKKIAVSLAAVLLVAGAAAVLLLLLNDKKAGDTLVRNIDSIYESGDCVKGLNELGSTDQSGLNDAQKEKLLQFKADCNYKLSKYDEALKNSDELIELYQKQGNDEKALKIVELQDRIRTSQETERVEKENREKDKNLKKDTYNGPLL